MGPQVMTDGAFVYFILGVLTAIFALLWGYDRFWQTVFCILLWPVVWIGWAIAILAIMLYRNQR